MTEPIKPLSHHETVHSDEDTLRRDARAHLGRFGALQIVAELLARLRSEGFEWWSPSVLRRTWPPGQRMRWLAERPDLRQQITTRLTGFPRNAARSRSPEFQGELLESVLVHGDISDAELDAAFDPADLAVYGPARQIWAQFYELLPWHDDGAAMQRFAAWMLRALLAERSALYADLSRRPVLSPLDVRSAIDARVWQSKLPAELRAVLDEARLKHERSRPREPYHSRHELSIVTPEMLATHLSLLDLQPVLLQAETAMGFGAATEAHESGTHAVASRAPESAPRLSFEPPFSDPYRVPAISVHRVAG